MPKSPPVVVIVFSDVPDNFSVIPSVSSAIVVRVFSDVPDKLKLVFITSPVVEVTLTEVPDKE